MFNRSFVRLKGLEPPRREASDPKSDVATNYTTAALEIGYKGNPFFITCKYLKEKIEYIFSYTLFGILEIVIELSV